MAEAKRLHAWCVLQSLYAKHAPRAVLRRAERLYHQLSIAAYEEERRQPAGSAS